MCFVVAILCAYFYKVLAPFLNNNEVEAGVDEAGRGCYAGAVVAAAVILPKDFHHPLLNDSKKLKEKDRELLRPIIEKESIAFSVNAIDNTVIDQVNILQATYLAMHGAIDGLKKKPTHLLIDGNRFKPYKKTPHTCIIKGDGLYASIAAASILAKTYRDAMMHELHQLFPDYGWDQNKGYGTLTHRNAIANLGITPLHRKSFNIIVKQIELF